MSKEIYNVSKEEQENRSYCLWPVSIIDSEASYISYQPGTRDARFETTSYFSLPFLQVLKYTSFYGELHFRGWDINLASFFVQTREIRCLLLLIEIIHSKMFKHLLRSGYPRISRKFEMALSDSGVSSKIELPIYRNVYMKKCMSSRP